ncbi:MAG TPA: MBL fold metallo-hydrolase [Fimbriimonadaceae bacterium]|nr:MBL fold metallo-hydrolase [Fimbriimonadaceae bacterium]
MAEAIILGSGTSNGVPMLGVDYPPSFLANPKNHRTRCSLLLAGPEGNVLVDCPPELRLQLLREDVKAVEAVVITHTHADHIMGMDDLRSLCLVHRRAMPVYTTPEYQADIRRVFSYAFEALKADVAVPKLDLIDVPETLDICGLTLRFFTVMHGPWPVLGVRVKDFAYITDVNHIPAPAWEMLQDLDVLVLDGVRKKPHPTHFHLERSLEVAAELGARTTYLTHLSHDYDHDEAEQELPPGVRLAYDGLRIPL